MKINIKLDDAHIKVDGGCSSNATRMYKSNVKNIPRRGIAWTPVSRVTGGETHHNTNEDNTFTEKSVHSNYSRLRYVSLW